MPKLHRITKPRATRAQTISVSPFAAARPKNVVFAEPGTARSGASDVIPNRALLGSQTLLRGLDVLETIAKGTANLGDLSEALNLNRSTVHRLATALVDLRYLSFIPRTGYSLGPKLLELGFLARQQLTLARVAHPHLEALAQGSGDTVHLGILEGRRALYLDKVPGRRRVEICSMVGERHPLRSTGLGKALILDENEERLREFYEYESQQGARYKISLSSWLRRMRKYARTGYALDLEENEDRIRCVAAPIRDVTGEIVGAISVSSAAQYLDNKRIEVLAVEVRKTANLISAEMGMTETRTSAAKLSTSI